MSPLKTTRPAAVGPLQVLVTRPADQAAEWVAALRDQGVDAQALPLIDIEPAVDRSLIDGVWHDLASYALVMFVSPNAAMQFWAQEVGASAPQSVRPSWPCRVLVASPGPGTSQCLRSLGVPAEQIIDPGLDARQFDSEALWLRLQHRPWRGQRVLVVAGEGGRDWLAQQLQAQGAVVQRLEVYRRVPPPWSALQRQLIDQALASPLRYLWFFSSSQAIENLLHRYPAPQWQQSRALATHPRIAQTARQAGFGALLETRPTLEAVVACIQSLPNLV